MRKFKIQRVILNYLVEEEIVSEDKKEWLRKKKLDKKKCKLRK